MEQPPDEPNLYEELRLNWPEHPPENPDAVDHESAAIADRRRKVMTLYQRKRSMRAVADELKCGLGTVCRDVNHVLDSWALIAVQDAAKHVARELARLNYLEAEAQAAWERSMGEVTETTATRRPGANGRTSEGASVKKKQRDGNPKFLGMLIDIWEKRCRLLRLLPAEDRKAMANDSPTKMVAGIDPMEVV